MRKFNRKSVQVTAEGCKVETNGSEIVLSTPKATVTNIKTAKRDLSWLMADVLSTPSGYRA